MTGHLYWVRQGARARERPLACTHTGKEQSDKYKNGEKELCALVRQMSQVISEGSDTT